MLPGVERGDGTCDGVERVFERLQFAARYESARRVEQRTDAGVGRDGGQGCGQLLSEITLVALHHQAPHGKSPALVGESLTEAEERDVRGVREDLQHVASRGVRRDIDCVHKASRPERFSDLRACQGVVARQPVAGGVKRVGLEAAEAAGKERLGAPLR